MDAAYTSTPLTPTSLGIALLRLAPLIISSGSLMCAWDQQNAFRSFLAPKLLEKKGDISAHVVVEWFAEFAKPTKWVIFLSYPLALSVALVNVFVDVGLATPSAILNNNGGKAAVLAASAVSSAGGGLHPQTKAFYIAGGVLSILHYWFGSWSMMWNARISRKVNVGQQNYDALRGWLANNFARMCWVNVPAWLMFVCATATFVKLE
jgi:hypothetical protein